MLSGGFRTTELVRGAWSCELSDPGVSRWAERLKRRADELLENRLSFFHLEKVYLGDPVDWNRDHESGSPLPVDSLQRSTTGITA